MQPARTWPKPSNVMSWLSLKRSNGTTFQVESPLKIEDGSVGFDLEQVPVTEEHVTVN